MNGENDLPHQPDMLQQLPQMENKGSPLWAMIFITLILINGVFFYYAGLAVNQTAGGVSLIVIIPIALILLIIGLLAVFFYIRKQHPHSIARAISYAALILILVGIVIGILMAFSIVFPIVFPIMF